MPAHLYDPDPTGGGVGNHGLVGFRLSLVAILSELGVERFALALFDLHRTRSERTRSGWTANRSTGNCITCDSSCT